MRRDGSEIPVSDSATPIRDYHGKIIGAVMVFRDISNHQQREQTWLQTQRLASVGRLAATIAHELNNPLQAVSNLLFLIGQERDPLAIHHYTIEASQELRRASEIAKQTLSFVRGAGERNPVSVGQLFEEVLLLNRNKLKNKNIQVDRRYISEMMVTARTGEIRQVLGNLVGDMHWTRSNSMASCTSAPSPWNIPEPRRFSLLWQTMAAVCREEHQARVFEPILHHEERCRYRSGSVGGEEYPGPRRRASVSIRSKVELKAPVA